MNYWTKRRKILKQVDRYIDAIEQSYSTSDQEEACPMSLNPYPQTSVVSKQPQLSTVNDDLSDTSTTSAEIPSVSLTREASQDQAILSDVDAQRSQILISSSEFSDTDDNDSPLASDLANWAVENRITHVALSRLLCILRKTTPDLPKDPRTLLGTNVKVVSTEIPGGQYYHIGIKNGIESQLNKFNDIRMGMGTLISLQINIDGLPIFKSSNAQFWPILGLIECIKNNMQINKEPFIIGLFYGKSKPASIDKYLEDFVKEASILQQIGITYQNKYYPFNISAFICDAPARSFVKQIKGHSGYFGCDKYTERGSYVGKVTFPGTSAPLRLDESFDESKYIDHRTGTTPLSSLSLGMVSQFPIDYMHLVCLGVMRKLILLWCRGPLKTRLGPRVIAGISTMLKSFHLNIPCEFNRKPRSFAEFERWKATELRQFLLYTGPVILKQHHPEELYNNFMLLSVGINILLNVSLCSQYCDYAHSLLILFVQHFGELYGQDNITYNVHVLIHLNQEANKFGVLDNISAFPFENFLGKLKRMIRKANSPLEQVIRRLSENYGKFACKSPKKFLCKPHCAGPVPKGLVVKDQYAEIYLERFVIKLTESDNCVKLINNDVVVVQNIVIDNQGDIKIIYKKFCHKEDFFTYPLDSEKLEIFKLVCLDKELNVCTSADISKKYVLLQFRSAHIGLPLLHM